MVEEYVAGLYPQIRRFRQWIDNLPQHYRTNIYLSAGSDRVSEDKVERLGTSYAMGISIVKQLEIVQEGS